MGRRSRQEARALVRRRHAALVELAPHAVANLRDEAVAEVREEGGDEAEDRERAGEAGVALPAPAPVEGPALAKALVEAGTTSDGTFWSGYLFDKALSHNIHNQVMGDIESTHGADMDMAVHKILNQAMYDVAQALDMKDVKLATLN